MENNQIAEVRGIAKQQNLESEMEEIVEEKLNEFPDKEKYKKKVSDMKRLTKIYNEFKDRELSDEELRFLYEIDDTIDDFGYKKDPRIEEVLAGRDFKKDIPKVLNCSEDEVSNDENDVLNGKNIVYFRRDLDLGELRTAKGLKLPKIVNGDLNLWNLTTYEGLKLPEIINGDLNLSGLTTAEGLELPKTVNGNLNLSVLTTAKGLKLPKTIKGGLFLVNLTTLEGLIVPEGFSCESVFSFYGITKEDLIAKSLEKTNIKVKKKEIGFANVWILLLFTYIISLFISIFIFAK